MFNHPAIVVIIVVVAVVFIVLFRPRDKGGPNSIA
jgi:hypothetical protein